MLVSHFFNNLPNERPIMKKLGIALYGSNGHQVSHHLAKHPRARCAAYAEFPDNAVPSPNAGDPPTRAHATLDELLGDKSVDLVSLCSPRRADQARDAIRCLEAGKHAYAEKPCALSERELDAILHASQKSDRKFHEMAGTAFTQPWREMRRLVREETIGEVVQVIVQKSYPYRDTRPADEGVDGGLTLQVGIHAARFVEHVAGVRIARAECFETRRGNPRHDELRMASSVLMQFENGGVGTMVMNYLNPPKFPSWGNESLRIFGTKGFIEAVDGGKRTRLVLNDRDCGPLTLSEPETDYLDFMVDEILDGKAMPFTLEEELHPLRVLIKAKATARLVG